MIINTHTHTHTHAHTHTHTHTHTHHTHKHTHTHNLYLLVSICFKEVISVSIHGTALHRSVVKVKSS